MVYEAILFKGKMNALDLRQEAGLPAMSLSRFNARSRTFRWK